ncbi:PL29 family lyase N-terminal domain-containing protein [Phocaeicola sp.]
MNKKFLSAILFGALMVTSTGTFVSCKDYDDDIDRIDNSLKDLKSQIDALQTKVDAGKYVTNVETTTSGITIHLSDGSSYPITNGKDGDKGEAGAAGDKVEINDDGFFIINGKATDWKAVAKDATGEVIKIKTPTISEDGCWVFYDEKGEAHPTTIKVAPVTAVQNAADQSWTLTVWDANGKSQTIKLPTAASLLTELDLAGWANFSDVTKDFSLGGSLKNDELSVEYAWVEKIIKTYDSNKETPWSAQKEVTKHQVLTTLAPNSTKLVARIAPAELDPSTLKFTLQDSKGNVLPIALGTPQKFTGALTRGASSSYAFIPMDVTADTYDAAKKYTDLFPTNRVYSLVEASNYRSTYSKFTIKTSKATVTEQKVVKLNPDNGTEDYYYGDGTPAFQYFKVDLNKPTALVFGTEAKYVYDYYVEPEDPTVAELFGYSADKKNGTFTLAKSADQITKAPLTLNVYALHIDGKIYKSQIQVKPTSRLVDEVVLNAGNVTIAKSDKADKMAFTISLADMFTSLGTDNTKVWQSSTLGAKNKTVNSVKIGDTPKTVNEEFVWIKADGKATNNIYEAASVKVYVAYTPALSVARICNGSRL